MMEALKAAYRSKPVRTFAQTLAGLLTAAVLAGHGFDAISWPTALSAAGLAAVFSFLQAVADGTPLVGDPTPAPGQLPDRPDVPDADV